ncbi:hypothetical protein FGG08_001241 [Glutinoglossum americanum]|uniref:RRM domain-containing protein n=1 Tax=Glutinoglossum americanum TaxID=1670608 RepID=A0A9P8I8K3_9PEZI|nr:hypothetical protein FGG08_001241 [Glutinoglossum americanum]
MSASAVENVTASLANTKISDPVTDATTSGDNKAANEAAAASATDGRRLYIGNLAYATTEGELKEFFKGYLVESTSIPTNPRTSRPVGYAFVDLSTPSEAERAISELSGKEVLDRKVSVQLARKPEPAGEKSEGAVSGGEGGSSGEGGRRRGGGRGRGRGRARGGRAGRAGRGRRPGGENGQVEATEAAPADAPRVALPLTETTNEGHSATEGAEGTSPSEANKDGKPRIPRERKQRGPPEDGVPSKIKVMVANLPYDLSEETLKQLFADYQPSSAKIALRPIPRFMVKKLQARNEPRKGRGFGFVTLASEELQQKAVAEMNGKLVDGREIAVKIAIDSPGKEDDDINHHEIEEKKENGVREGEATAA